MSLREITCYELVCDGCQATCDDTEYETPIHFGSRGEVRDSDGWTEHWETPEAGPDLCPRCRCARDGHRWGAPAGFDWGDNPDRGLRFCDVCREMQAVLRDGDTVRVVDHG